MYPHLLLLPPIIVIDSGDGEWCLVDGEVVDAPVAEEAREDLSVSQGEGVMRHWERTRGSRQARATVRSRGCDGKGGERQQCAGITGAHPFDEGDGAVATTRERATMTRAARGGGDRERPRF